MSENKSTNGGGRRRFSRDDFRPSNKETNYSTASELEEEFWEEEYEGTENFEKFQKKPKNTDWS